MITITPNKWHVRFVELAEHLALWSKDPSTKVGCVLFNPISHVLVGSGYNGFPPGTTDSEELLNNREDKLARVLHAEVNALLTCAEQGTSTRGLGMAVSFFPCSQCAGAIVRAGIKLIVCRTNGFDHPRWGSSFRVSDGILASGGVKVVLIGG